VFVQGPQAGQGEIPSNKVEQIGCDLGMVARENALGIWTAGNALTRMYRGAGRTGKSEDGGQDRLHKSGPWGALFSEENSNFQCIVGRRKFDVIQVKVIQLGTGYNLLQR
jgi:hypothetical protein